MSYKFLSYESRDNPLRHQFLRNKTVGAKRASPCRRIFFYIVRKSNVLSLETC